MVDLNYTIAAVLASYHLILTKRKRDEEEEEEEEEDFVIEDSSEPFMRNTCPSDFGPPLSNIGKSAILEDIFEDHNRNYCKIFTNFYGWEFFALTEHLKPLIERRRETPWRKYREDATERNSERKKQCKYSAAERLYFALDWLANGTEFRQEEFYYKYAKSSLHEDLPHVLKAIIDGLDDFLRWPTAQERLVLATHYEGIFKNCVGLGDISETLIEKSKDKTTERATFSGKAHGNSMKNFTVCDFSGRIIYCADNIQGRPNDRSSFTHLPLYMDQGLYFDDDQFVAVDGGFDGDGPLRSSFREPNTPARVAFNLAFKEVRLQIENVYGRIQNWFGVLGNKKAKFNCNPTLLSLSIQAACRLHNWMLHTRKLNYDPILNRRYLFREYY